MHAKTSSAGVFSTLFGDLNSLHEIRFSLKPHSLGRGVRWQVFGSSCRRETIRCVLKVRFRQFLVGDSANLCEKSHLSSSSGRLEQNPKLSMLVSCLFCRQLHGHSLFIPSLLPACGQYSPGDGPRGEDPSSCVRRVQCAPNLQK